MIVALLNQKGGVGKTTLATHIAGELALRGQQVILLDADPQGSSLDWTQRRSQQGLPRLFSAVGLARETLHQEVARSPSSRCPHCTRKSASASSSPTVWPLGGSHEKPRQTAPPHARSPRWPTSC